MKLSISMWGKALKTIPRLSKKEWDDLDPVAQWLVATRSAVFILTAFSVLVGSLLALIDRQFNLGRALLCLVGLVFAHAANNLLNDYTDFERGVDKDNYFRTLYGPQPLENGWWTKKRALGEIFFTGAVATLCGLALIITGGMNVVWLMLIGAFFLLFYTWPLKFMGLGEPSVILVWGPLMVGGTYLAITGNWSTNAALIGAVYALGPTTVLFGKHTDKLREDKKKKIHTLPVIIGEQNARWGVIAMLVAQPLFVTWLFLSGIVRWPMLIAFLGVPIILKTAQVFMKPRPTEKPKDFPKEFWPTYLAGYAFRANRITGSLFILGLIATIFIKH